jgi:dephospho-CoA kinase
MLRIGLTGGIGTGKTTVANIFKVLGIPVFDADTVAKQLMENDLQLQEQLIAQFGPTSFQDGKLNRAYLASIVFKDPYQLAVLNAMVHPILKSCGRLDEITKRPICY